MLFLAGVFLLLFLLLAVGTLGFWYLCSLDWLSALEASVFITTTIGLPPEVPRDEPLQQIFLLFFSLISVTVFLAIVVFLIGSLYLSFLPESWNLTKKQPLPQSSPAE